MTRRRKPRLPEIRIETRRIADLVPAAYNPRAISAQAMSGLASSVKQFGLVQPLIVNARTGHIVGGHQRHKVLVAEGVVETQVVVVDLPELEEKALNVALNNQHISGDWVPDALAGVLDEIKAGLPDLMDQLRFCELVVPEPKRGATDPDDVPATPEVPVSRPGDVWLLGPHRLVCGDSTDAGTVALALGGHKPFLMVTDPPYGVEYDADWRSSSDKHNKAVGEVKNDDRADWREAYALFPGDVAYVWAASLTTPAVLSSVSAVGFVPRSVLVWKKPGFAISRGHYHWQHELCVYAARRGRTARWCGDRKQSTVWEMDNRLFQAGASKEDGTGHSTQKPVEAMARPMRNHGAAGDRVYEPFCGSGTTIIAAEQERRVCSAIELHPPYVDVSVLRWQAFADADATLEGDGRTFADVAAERRGAT